VKDECCTPIYAPGGAVDAKARGRQQGGCIGSRPSSGTRSRCIRSLSSSVRTRGVPAGARVSTPASGR